MNKSTVVLLLVGIVVLCLSSPVMADAGRDYESYFGPAERDAAAKGDYALAEFAGKLLDAAKFASGQKDYQALLCEKAYEFGTKGPAGYAAAADAMKLLIEAMPDKKIAAREKLMKVQQLRYAKGTREDRQKLAPEVVELLVTCGDDKAAGKQLAEAIALYRQALTLATGWKSGRATEIKDKIEHLSAALEAERMIAALKARLEKDPKDAEARRELVMAYLGQLDNPAEAVKLLTPDLDEGFRTYVPLAAAKVEDLKEAACIQLAEWLVAVAEKASPADKGVLLGRAKASCERYIELHTTQDAALVNGKMLLDKVEKAMCPASITLDLGKGITMKFVLIPAGKFLMGSPEREKDRKSSEGPQREVTISRPFYMGVYEVTQAQYQAVIGANPSEFKGIKNPVEQVSWDDAVEFCKNLSGKAGKTVRLPTEAEWEYACRAGTSTRFSFGDDDAVLYKYGNYADRTCTTPWGGNKKDKAHSDGYDRTSPVGSFQPNAFGLYDMHGNVWEWCSDWFADSYADAKNVDPTGADSGTHRVLRGGSWAHLPQRCRSAFRGDLYPNVRSFDIGFRVVVDLK